jgi:hypothetical protein
MDNLVTITRKMQCLEKLKICILMKMCKYDIHSTYRWSALRILNHGLKFHEKLLVDSLLAFFTLQSEVINIIKTFSKIANPLKARV